MSLRDVERAMNVMVWFYNHRDALNPLMDGATDEDSDDEDDDDDDSNADDEEDEIFQVILIKWNSKRNIVVLFISNPGCWSKEPASFALAILTSSDFANKLNQAFCSEKNLGLCLTIENNTLCSHWFGSSNHCRYTMK